MSKAVDPQTRTLIASILRKAHTRKAQNDITGLLCERTSVFLQALEGECGQLTRLYSRISAMARIDALIAQGRVIDAPLSFGNG